MGIKEVYEGKRRRRSGFTGNRSSSGFGGGGGNNGPWPSIVMLIILGVLVIAILGVAGGK